MLLLSGVQTKIWGPQYAFRKSYQTAEPVFILRNLIEKCCEWDLSLHVLDGDITAAYDNVRHARLCRALDRRQCPHILIRAWMKLTRKLPVALKLDASTRSKYIYRTKSIGQGGSDGPSLFNVTLDDISLQFISDCKARGWGF